VPKPQAACRFGVEPPDGVHTRVGAQARTAPHGGVLVSYLASGSLSVPPGRAPAAQNLERRPSARCPSQHRRLCLHCPLAPPSRPAAAGKAPLSAAAVRARTRQPRCELRLSSCRSITIQLKILRTPLPVRVGRLREPPFCRACGAGRRLRKPPKGNLNESYGHEKDCNPR
jgi:hypothetical protein